MKTSMIKKILVVTLAGTMALGCSLTALADSGSNKGSSSNVVATPAASTEAVVEVVEKNVVAGKASTVPGAYIADVIDGAAVATSAADIKAGYGLAAGETPFVRTFNVDAKKSPLAMNVFTAVAGSQNAILGPCVHVDFGKKVGGKFFFLAADGQAVSMKFALKRSFFQAGMNYAVICVRPGGAFTIIPAVADANGVITFGITGGQATYAVIKY